MSAVFPLNATNRLVDRHVPEADPAQVENRRIQALLQCFNLGVQQSFVDGSVQGLREHCTDAHFERMGKKHRNWREKQVTALNLVSLEFLAFDLEEGGEQARAFAFEKWVFIYEDGREVRTKGSVDRYELKKESGAWKVDAVTFFAAEAA